MQPDGYQTSHLHVSETLSNISGYVEEGGACKMIRASQEGWSVGGGHKEDVTGLRQLKTPHHSLVLGMYILPTVPTVGGET